MKKMPQRWPFWLNGLLLLLPVWFFWQALHPVVPPEWPEQPVGPFTVAVTPADTAAPYTWDGQSLKDFSARFCAGCVAQIRQAWLSSGAQPQPLPADLTGLLHGDSQTQHAHAPVPAQWQSGDRLWLTVQAWDGSEHHVSWSPAGVP